MLFDLTGHRHDTPGTMKTIDLTTGAGIGVIGEEGESLFPENNPHEVSERFAATLIHSGRAQEHDPEHPITVSRRPEGGPKGAAGRVQNGDPKGAQHGDPK